MMFTIENRLIIVCLLKHLIKETISYNNDQFKSFNYFTGPNN